MTYLNQFHKEMTERIFLSLIKNQTPIPIISAR